MSRLILVLPLWLFLATADAIGKCEENCYCGGNLSQLPIPSPKGFSLTGACDVADMHYKPIDLRNAMALRPEAFDSGTYFYRGRVTMPGSVQKIDDGPNGAMVYFYPATVLHSNHEKLSRLQREVLLERITLHDDEKIGAAKLTVTEKTSWCANATLIFRDLSIYIADTEGIGSGAVKYDIVRLGKYRKC